MILRKQVCFHDDHIRELAMPLPVLVPSYLEQPPIHDMSYKLHQAENKRAK